MLNIRNLRKAGMGIFLLALLVIAVGYFSHCSRVPEKKTSGGSPRFEIYPKEEIVPDRRIPEPRPSLPKVAIIIDDMGYDSFTAEKFLNFDAVITFSIFPHSPSGKTIAGKARAKGWDIMLHLPMEPVEYPAVDPGPGAILAAMTPEQLVLRLESNLDSLPFIKGVNNHMGSKVTTIPHQMYKILSVLKKRRLFFIDSLTTVDSLCRSSARLLQIPFAQRDVFLDHIQDADVIRRQIVRLMRIADDYGEAIGIGHPYEVTYHVLQKMLPELKKRVRLVPASEVVHTIG
ncbi:divergent polysaccharide deacetylase family protein [Desulfococcaceae bacterium HSG8]|nr:divergent polysaccharide deacetylase family protein [Desulfococcaceae bacterium HSG8]